MECRERSRASTTMSVKAGPDQALLITCDRQGWQVLR